MDGRDDEYIRHCSKRASVQASGGAGDMEHRLIERDV